MHNSSKMIAFTLITFFLLVLHCQKKDESTKLKELCDQYVNFWNTGNFDNIEEVLNPDFELRMTPEYKAKVGIENFKGDVTFWRTAYPDFHIRMEELIFADNAATIRWTITATNTGEGNHPATGKKVIVPGISIIHISEGKIKDEWIASNDLSWMQQLGFQLKAPF